AQLFNDLPEAISNTMLIAERCHLLFNLGERFNLPRYPRPDGFNTDFEYLRELAHHGLRQRIPGFSEEILKRLDYELEVIRKRGLCGYFLIVKDLVDFARDHKIPVGPGRGSAVGSLVLYVLGITDINPLDYGLIFERFLNPNRRGMPDIDIDFGDVLREEVLRYIVRRYGERNTTQVITFGTMQARAVVRDVGRVLGLSYGEVDRIAKMIPHHQSINQAISLSSELRKIINEKAEYDILIKTAERLEGLVRHASTHAAGIVITPTDLTDYIPLYRSPESKEISTQFEKTSLEAVGILKMDLLGLRTLTVIDETLKLIGLKKEDIRLDDKRTFELLKRGETVGIFQLESEGMRGILRKFKPENLKELIAVVALYRPGPLGNVNLDNMIKNKKTPDKIRYLHPKLKSILAETYGMIIYQEQVMEIAHQIAGFSMAQADQLRRAMSKKVFDLMERLKDDFKTGAKKNGIRPKLAEEIFEYLAPFAGYGFNKSHATAYALIAYQTAYLKAHYPIDFMLANLNSELNDTDRLAILCQELKNLSIKILPPDVNRSGPQFLKENNGIRYGLSGLKNVGLSAAEAIVAEREKRGRYKNIFDFLGRVTGINRKVVESLVKAGAFDCFGESRARMLEIVQDRNAHHGLQGSLFTKEKVEEWSRLTRTNFEKESFGFYFSTHPIECYKLEYEALGLTPLRRIREFGDGSEVKVGGIIAKKEIKRDRKGEEYARIRIEDLTGSIEVLVFSDLLKRVRGKIRSDAVVVVKGRISNGEKPIIRSFTTTTESERILPRTRFRRSEK
ncbi:MAG TPA: DNA polymerase III subunit alpha, partial [bacterium (Candidatus Stahlbacteria)]|nr:DNA polymerase III subunit alpha [Candidatus Stahlbacteria bacterium]